MLTETYKGRRLKVKKGREWGTLVGTCNGTPVTWPVSRDEAAAMDGLRGQVDWIDREPVNGARWGAEWYAPGTYTMCEEDLHPVAIGGKCQHPSCAKRRGEGTEDGARTLGRRHGRAEVAPFGDLADAGSADLMTALGETGGTGNENLQRRLALLGAYREEWENQAGRPYGGSDA